jgi:hypothetical protein
VALKEPLVGRDVFDADDSFVAFHLDDPVHQKKRIPVGNTLEYFSHIEHGIAPFLPLDSGKRAHLRSLDGCKERRSF